MTNETLRLTRAQLLEKNALLQVVPTHDDLKRVCKKTLADLMQEVSELLRPNLGQEQAQRLQQLLTAKVQCGAARSVMMGRASRGGKMHYHMTVCSYVEYLFVENRPQLLALIAQLKASEDEALYDVFIASLKNTALGDVTALFAYTEPMRKALFQAVEALHSRAAELRKVSNDSVAEQKADRISKLATQLDCLRVSIQFFADEAGRPLRAVNESMRHLAVLQFKLEFIALLHENDHDRTVVGKAGVLPGFNRHRTLQGKAAIVIVNVCTVLFTAGIANLLLRLSTQHASSPQWLFFAQTRTQKTIAALDNVFDAHLDQSVSEGPKIRFMSKL